MSAVREIEDAKRLAEQRGYRASDFTFRVVENVRPMVRFTVIATLGGVSIEYQGGAGMNWWPDFDRDLCEGWQGVGMRPAGDAHRFG